MGLKFNSKEYTKVIEYHNAIHTYCYCENNCKYYYGEIMDCMYGEDENLLDKSICKCNIDNMFR